MRKRITNTIRLEHSMDLVGLINELAKWHT